MVDVISQLEQLFTDEFRFFFALFVFVGGLLLGYVIGRSIQRLLVSSGVPDAVEGTPFERTARGLGTSTVSLISQLTALFIAILATLLALRILGLSTEFFFGQLTAFMPRLFVAALAIILGLIISDKAGLVVSERLRSIKLPEVNIIPQMVRYSIIYIAVLIALGQIGVATGALLILLGVYVFGVVFLGGIAFRDLLSSSAAGVYLLLNQPYGIGDEIAIGDRRGIVQEVDVFVTHIESDDEEYIIPNAHVFDSGIVRIRT
ncbi:mechanosensitive ion channel domain-containing protein [Haladaptatus sp. YSMS36]|uniref:mechanosensitive ion channel domain-containing protein n=1 Tax=Haladaptatus sp. YSMS36 TaxID=3033384 RepID=UPI0023E8EC8A|nr:mechanosensitive ion channel domain-containing protein [Haladaptatus sp. YSMS36]